MVSMFAGEILERNEERPANALTKQSERLMMFTVLCDAMDKS